MPRAKKNIASARAGSSRTPKESNKQNERHSHSAHTHNQTPRVVKATFPIQKIHEMLLNAFPTGTVEPVATVFLTAVMEYIAAEILETAGNMAKSAAHHHEAKITEEEIKEAMLHDDELNFLVVGAQQYDIEANTNP